MRLALRLGSRATDVGAVKSVFGLLRRLLRWMVRQPEWLRPPLYGLSIVIAIMIPRVLLGLPAILSGKAALGELPLVLGAAAAAGFCGGLAYSTTRPALRRLGRPGDYVSAVLLIDGYLGALLLASPYVFERSAIPEDAQGWALWGALSTVVGLAAGAMWFGPKGIEAQAQERGKPQLSPLERDKPDGTSEQALLVSGWIRSGDLERLLQHVAGRTGTHVPSGEAARLTSALEAVSVDDEVGVETELAGAEPVPLHFMPDEDDPILAFDVLLAGRHLALGETLRSELAALTVDPLRVSA